MTGKHKTRRKNKKEEGEEKKHSSDHTCAMNFPSISCLFISSAVGSP